MIGRTIKKEKVLDARSMCQELPQRRESDGGSGGGSGWLPHGREKKKETDSASGNPSTGLKADHHLQHQGVRLMDECPDQASG